MASQNRDRSSSRISSRLDRRALPQPARHLERPEYEVIHVRLSDLRTNPRNARTHSKKQIGQIAASIREFGFTSPVLTDETGMLLAGHGRFDAAQLLGLKTIPASQLPAYPKQGSERCFSLTTRSRKTLAGTANNWRSNSKRFPNFSHSKIWMFRSRALSRSRSIHSPRTSSRPHRTQRTPSTLRYRLQCQSASEVMYGNLGRVGFFAATLELQTISTRSWAASGPTWRSWIHPIMCW